jgi:hypothetical protein
VDAESSLGDAESSLGGRNRRTARSLAQAGGKVAQLGGKGVVGAGKVGLYAGAKAAQVRVSLTPRRPRCHRVSAESSRVGSRVVRGACTARARRPQALPTPAATSRSMFTCVRVLPSRDLYAVMRTQHPLPRPQEPWSSRGAHPS